MNIDIFVVLILPFNLSQDDGGSVELAHSLHLNYLMYVIKSTKNNWISKINHKYIWNKTTPTKKESWMNLCQKKSKFCLVGYLNCFNFI